MFRRTLFPVKYQIGLFKDLHIICIAKIPNNFHIFRNLSHLLQAPRTAAPYIVTDFCLLHNFYSVP